MLNTFGQPFCGLLNDVNTTFPSNIVQRCWIQHVEHVWPAFLWPFEWRWYNISIQHCSTLLNSTCWTRFATLLNKVDSTLPSNTVQHCWIQHVKHVWPALLSAFEWCWSNIAIQHCSTWLNSTCWTRLAAMWNDVGWWWISDVGWRWKEIGIIVEFNSVEIVEWKCLALMFVRGLSVAEEDLK